MGNFGCFQPIKMHCNSKSCNNGYVVVVVVVVAVAVAVAVAVVGFFNNHYDRCIVDKVGTQCKTTMSAKKYDTSLHINIYHCTAYITESFCA